MKVQQAMLTDVEEILALEETIIAENQFFITTEAEFSADRDKDRQKISAILTQTEKNAVVFVAKSDDRIVGVIIFRSSNLTRLAHHGSFSIYIDSDYRNKGIGTQLLQTLIKWAEEHPIIEKICLGVFATNTSAIYLYKKMGFEEEGRKVNDIKLSHDEYVDDVLMYKMV